MRTLKRLGVLIVALLLALLLSPIQIVIVVVRFIKIVCKITEETLTYLIKSIRDEVIK